MKTKIFILVGCLILLAGGYVLWTKLAAKPQPLATAPTASSSQTTSTAATVANPASVNCTKQGGQLKLATKPDSSQYGVCYFLDNRQCEEWALLRGDCPVGGVKVTGYMNESQVFCAISGGEVIINQDLCKFKSTQTCTLADFYQGNCTPSAAAGSTDRLSIDQPTAGQLVTSPLTVKGAASGGWYFEASFPIKLIDDNGRELAAGTAQAQGDWQTDQFVPFTVVLKFAKPTTAGGKLIFSKDNPSGLPTNTDQIELPVKFK
jgi:putative hemolysin